VTDILTRLDIAIGGPDRRTKTGRVRKLTPMKIETALLVDAKAEIERLRLMLGSLLAVTAGRMGEAEIAGHYGMLGLDVMRRAREVLGDE
jgi:hypothetical protein